MKNVLVAWILYGLAACGSVDEADQGASGSLENDVSSFLDAYQDALDGTDMDALRSFYADDGRFEWIEDGSVRYRSPDDVVAALSGLLSGAAIRTEYSARTISPVGADGATVSTRFRTVMGEGPSAFEFGGMMTMVLEKGPDGWRIVGGHTSSGREDGR